MGQGEQKDVSERHVRRVGEDFTYGDHPAQGVWLGPIESISTSSGSGSGIGQRRDKSKNAGLAEAATCRIRASVRQASSTRNLVVSIVTQQVSYQAARGNYIHEARYRHHQPSGAGRSIFLFEV